MKCAFASFAHLTQDYSKLMCVKYNMTINDYSHGFSYLQKCA